MGHTRTTVYLDENIHRALKLRAVILKTSLSELVNEAVKKNIEEDAIDLKAIQDRKNEKEAPLSIFLKELKQDGLYV